MTRTVEDAAAMLQVLAGYDPEDANSVDTPVPDYTAAFSQKGPLRVGVPRAYFYEGLHADIESAMNAALKVIGKLAAGVRGVEMPASNEENPCGRGRDYGNLHSGPSPGGPISAQHPQTV
jgi:aspartyl-tRNA(Asn)/glutamyl-tRNA(Gln) amidotransferase subunit A